MHVSQLRRYPVKAMAGEELSATRVDSRGIVGDRWFAVRDTDGRMASLKDTRRFRRRDGVTAYGAITHRDGAVWVTGGTKSWRVGDPELDGQLAADLGTPVEVAPEGAVAHQDAGQVSLVGSATLRHLAARWSMDLDPRRLRPNVVIETDRAFEEESWINGLISVGDAVVFEVVERAVRCRTVDVVQDGVNPDGQLLARLGRERDTKLAVYCNVVTCGTIEVGDRVELLAGEAKADGR